MSAVDPDASGVGGEPPADAPLDFLRPPDPGEAPPAPPAFVPTPAFAPTWRQPPNAGRPTLPAIPAASPRRLPGRRAATTRSPRSRSRQTVWPILLATAFVLGPFFLLPWLAGSGSRPSPVPAPTTSVAADLPASWSVSSRELRPDAPEAEFALYPDGSFDGPRVLDAGPAWVILSAGPDPDSRVPVFAHGLDAASGRELWHRELPHGICAARLLNDSLVCASALDWDVSRGQGTRWSVELIDPSTGGTRASREADASPALITVQHDRVLFLEQRQPAPHAVVTALDAALNPAFTLDLAGHGAHDELFSDNRITGPADQPTSELALDRPRVREVAGGLTAFWAGGATAFLDARTGRLVGLPHCSRLVDDGVRLWCNNVANAQSYDYRLAPGVQTDIGVRLAFPSRDPRDGDLCPPVFLDPDGRAVRVDAITGRSQGTLFASRNGTAFGMTTTPSVYHSGGQVLIADDAGVASVDLATGTVRWEVSGPNMDGLFRDGDRLFTVWFDITVLDAATGAKLGVHRQRHGIYTDAVGGALVGVGQKELARLVNP